MALVILTALAIGHSMPQYRNLCGAFAFAIVIGLNLFTRRAGR